jgi:hypothetical protein
MVIKNLEKQEVIGGDIYQFGPVSKATSNIFIELYEQFSSQIPIYNTPKVYNIRGELNYTDDNGKKSILYPDFMLYEKHDSIASYVLEIQWYTKNMNEVYEKKQGIYEKLGIREYWLLCPYLCGFYRYWLNDSSKYEGQFIWCDNIQFEIVKGLLINLGIVFQNNVKFLFVSDGVNEQEIDKSQTKNDDYPISAPQYDIFLGETAGTPQYGILGMAGTRRVAIDLNGCNTISIFGVPGGGKSYTVSTVLEMATMRIPSINQLCKSLGSVMFHYNESQDYAPECISMVNPNTKEAEIKKLKEVYRAEPASLDDVLLLVPADKVKQRQKEYPNIEVLPISFASIELDIKAWKFLMGATDNKSMYIHHINKILRKLRNRLTLTALKNEIEASRLSDTQKEYALNRLDIAGQFIDDTVSLKKLLKPGRMIIVDLRDEFIEKEQALGLFVVMLNIFAGVETYEGEKFNKLIVFDEAHKYMGHSELTKHVVETIRQMRHQGVTLLIASQDPPSLPNEIIELSSMVIQHRFNSPQWLKHLKKSIIALSELTPKQMADLKPGEAYIWANKASDPEFTNKAVKIYTRPRVTQHGGGTQKAVIDHSLNRTIN